MAIVQTMSKSTEDFPHEHIRTAYNQVADEYLYIDRSIYFFSIKHTVARTLSDSATYEVRIYQMLRTGANYYVVVLLGTPQNL